MRLSYSALDSFKICPAKYKFQYIERVKTSKSKEAVFGTLIHECLKVFHDTSATTLLSEDDLLKHFTKKWNSDLYENKDEDAFAFHQGVEILKKYYLQNQNKDFEIISLETAFKAPIFQDKDSYQITGRIERVDKLPDGSFEIIDYKTGRKMPPQEIVDNNLQLSIYYLGIIDRWPFLKQSNRPVKLSLYFLRHGEKISTFQNEKKIQECKEQILSLISQIQKSDFEPRSNPLCDWCQYQKYCPLFRHKFISEEKTIDSEKIKNIISEFFAVKERQSTDNKRLGELKGDINKYCDENNLDRIFGDNGYITRQLQKRIGYDFEEVKAILEPLGKWEEVLAINNAKLKKVITSLPYPIKTKITKIAKEKQFKVISVSRKK